MNDMFVVGPLNEDLIELNVSVSISWIALSCGMTFSLIQPNLSIIVFLPVAFMKFLKPPTILLCADLITPSGDVKLPTFANTDDEDND